jgi:membrane protein DedA with SNARE-associated domain/rhodanese-related sulfurtransferase
VTSSELTYPGVLLAVFGNQLCLPIPSIVFLMAAGALSAHGGMRTGIIVLLGVLGCLVGDGIWFWIGRRWGYKAMRILCRFSSDPRSCSHNAREKFRRYGLPLLCVAKFLPGVDAFLPPLSGAEGASIPVFFALDTVGSLLWSGFYVGIGYLFANELGLAISWTGRFGTVLGMVVGGPLVFYVVWRGLALLRMIRTLRLRRITPPMLARKLKSKRKVAVLDLSSFEEDVDSESVEGIPGAFSVDPSVLRKSPHIRVPNDVQIILYCSSGRDIVSARAAVDLKRVGVDKVWVLEGGLKAWREQGFPVSKALEAPEAVAKRYGVRLPPPSPAQIGDWERAHSGPNQMQT